MNNNDNTLTLDSSNFYALSAASSLAILTAYYVFSVAQVRNKERNYLEVLFLVSF